MTADVQVLPDGWTSMSLGDIGELIRGVTYKKPDASRDPAPGHLPLLRATNVTDSGLVFDDLVYVPQTLVSGDQRLRGGDAVIVASSGSERVVGRAAVLREDWAGSFGAFCFAYRPSDAVSPDWIALFFGSDAYRGLATKLAKGTNINNLKREHILEMRIALPPLQEQQRIVIRVEALRREVREGRSDLAAAGAYLEGLTDASIDEALTRAAEHADSFPLGELIERITSGSRDWKPYYHRGTEVFVLAQNVRPRRLDFSTVLNVDPPVTDPSRDRSAVAKNDVLVTIVGAGTGTVARVPDDLPGHYVCQSVALIRPRRDVLDGAYLELFLSARSWGQRIFADLMYGQGRPHLGFSEMKRIMLPLPSLSDQRAIVEHVRARLADASELQKPLRTLADDAATLDREIISAAIRGDLCVPDAGEDSTNHANERERTRTSAPVGKNSNERRAQVYR